MVRVVERQRDERPDSHSTTGTCIFFRYPPIVLCVFSCTPCEDPAWAFEFDLQRGWIAVRGNTARGDGTQDRKDHVSLNHEAYRTRGRTTSRRSSKLSVCYPHRYRSTELTAVYSRVLDGT